MKRSIREVQRVQQVQLVQAVRRFNKVPLVQGFTGSEAGAAGRGTFAVSLENP